MKTLLVTLMALVAFASQGQQAPHPEPFRFLTTWHGPVAIRTNRSGPVYAHIAKIPHASETFWASYRTNKVALREAGYSVCLRTGGWHAVNYTLRKEGR